MRILDMPRPGDLVIRRRPHDDRLVLRDVYVVLVWPTETVAAGPYLSYGYAFESAKRLIKDRSVAVWCDHAAPGEPERLEEVFAPGSE